MSDGRGKAFAEQLNDLEASGNVDRFVSEAFRRDAELTRPESHQQLQGNEGARVFWQQYLAYFDTIRSDFSRVTDTGPLSVLEWQSKGRLRGGGDITYRGVSVLDFDEDGQIARFATYYDTTPFHTTPTTG
jgi:ketosteroid isomerase-like protein